MSVNLSIMGKPEILGEDAKDQVKTFSQKKLNFTGNHHLLTWLLLKKKKKENLAKCDQERSLQKWSDNGETLRAAPT